MLAKMLQNDAKLIQKLTYGFKNPIRNLCSSRQAEKSPKSLLLSKKYTCSAKTLYTEDFSNIIFNYLHENLPNYLYHF